MAQPASLRTEIEQFAERPVPERDPVHLARQARAAREKLHRDCKALFLNPLVGPDAFLTRTAFISLNMHWHNSSSCNLTALGALSRPV